MTAVQPPPLNILVFDVRRGNVEGEEDDKVLAFYPSSRAQEDRTGLAGLLHGLLLFTASVTQGGDMHVAETDKEIWVLHEAEPAVYFAIAASRTWLPRHVSQDNLRGLLVHTHLLGTVLHGPLAPLLAADPSGAAARQSLQSLLDHVGRQLSTPLSWIHRELRNPLGDLATTHILRLPTGAALAVETLCNRLMLVEGPDGSTLLSGLVLLQQSTTLWTSLPPTETAALYSLAASAFLQQPQTGRAGPRGGREPGDVADGDSWVQLRSGFVVLGTMEASFRAAASADNVAVTLPRVHINGQRYQLLPYADERLMVLMLLPDSIYVTRRDLAALQDELVAHCRRLSQRLADEARSMGTASEPGHVPGFRYLLQDADNCSAEVTPRTKISSMTHHSRALATTLRDSAARLQFHTPDGGILDNNATSCELHEVVVKSNQDCWAALKMDGPRRLLVVREKRAEKTAAESLNVLDDFTDSMLT